MNMKREMGCNLMPRLFLAIYVTLIINLSLDSIQKMFYARRMGRIVTTIFLILLFGPVIWDAKTLRAQLSFISTMVIIIAVNWLLQGDEKKYRDRIRKEDVDYREFLQKEEERKHLERRDEERKYQAKIKLEEQERTNKIREETERARIRKEILKR